LNDAGSPHPALLETWPYAHFLGMRAQIDGTELTGVLPFSQHLIGNPILPALHGGVVAAFLELTALAQLSVRAGPTSSWRTVDTTVDYLRPARAVDSYARAEVLRMGRRVASIRAILWQSNPAHPVAAMRGNFVLNPAQSLSRFDGPIKTGSTGSSL
jgi:uncharacterized protein (TIGR00369 family)